MTPPLLAYYGDDFTGSADVMEVLQWAGLRTVLFLDPPSSEQLARFDNLRAFGVAGSSRSMSVAQMDEHLPRLFKRLQESGAPIVHYKCCSTFDSSPEVGSIGRAMELGRKVFNSKIVPIVVAAPQLGRYQAFGNLFARSGQDSQPFRLDRHPTMRAHPITPMNEADLRVHLQSQTDLRIDLFDVLQLDNDSYSATLEADALLFDVLYPLHLPKIGSVLEAIKANQPPMFTVGSSGIEYALTDYWAKSGRLTRLQSHSPRRPRFAAVDRLIVITGSCSPVNGRQIAWAENHGFETVALHPARLVNENTSGQAIDSAITEAADLVQRGANVILHTSRGPEDPRVAATTAALTLQGKSGLDIKLQSGPELGPKLGRILRGVLNEHRFTRVGVAGGDTSGHIARELGIRALQAIAPVAPGSPLCRANADNDLDGMEFFFKGGQVGNDDVWGTMLHGTANSE